MRLYKGTPVYYGEGAATCQQRSNDGLLGWFARILGFPKTPCYQPAEPPDVSCPGQQPTQPPPIP